MDCTGNSFFQVFDCLSEYTCAKIQSGLVRTTLEVAASPIGVSFSVTLSDGEGSLDSSRSLP
jgi:hypothetical protein